MSAARYTPERHETAVRRSKDALAHLEAYGSSAQPWLAQRCPLMCDYVLMLSEEVIRLRVSAGSTERKA